MKTTVRLLLLSIFGICTASAGTVGLVPPSVIHTGDTFDVGVLFTSDGMQGYQFDLLFPTFLQANSVTGSGFFSGTSLTSGSIDNSAGFIFLFGLLDSAGFNCGTDYFCSTDTLALINFTALSAGSGLLTIDTSDTAVDPALIVVDGGSFSIDPTATFDGAGVTVSDIASPAPEPGTFVFMVLALAIAFLRLKCPISAARRR